MEHEPRLPKSVRPRSNLGLRVALGLSGAAIMALSAFIIARSADRLPPTPRQPLTGRVEARAQATFSTSPAAVDERALKDISTSEVFHRIASVFGISGTETQGSYTLAIPRRDVLVFVEGNEVPTSAGVEHRFQFYLCPCGTTLVHGDYLLHEYEVNDVIDSLRQDPSIKIVGLSTFLLAAEPRLTLLRFQGEGEHGALAASLRRPFRWIGENRGAVAPTDAPPP